MVKIIKKFRLNAPASTSTTGGDSTKGTQTNPYTWEEYELLNSQGCWQGAFVEGHGYVIPDAFVITSYLRGSELGSDWEGYEWNEDDAGNHLPNPSPDEINNNGNAGGGGGGNGNAGGGGNGSGEGSGNNGNSPNNNDGRKHHKIVIDLVQRVADEIFTLNENQGYVDNEYSYDEIIFKRDNNTVATVHYDGYIPEAPIIKEKQYIDYSNYDRTRYATLLIIKGGTWKLYKDLVKAYRVEWGAHYFKDIPEDCAKKNGFPIGKKIELHPDDNRECIIVSVNNPTACLATEFEGNNCRVHSHPSNAYESLEDQIAASKAFYENGYKLFAIVHANSTDNNLGFEYFYPQIRGN